MNRLHWFAAFTAIALGLIAVLAARGSNRDLLPFLGRWTGGFEVKRVSTQAADPKELARNKLRGYLQLYASNRKFLMHLEGEQQTLDLGGTWRKTNFKRILLHFGQVKIDDAGGTQNQNPNLKFIPSADIRSAYSHDLVLELSLDGKSLNGLLMDIGSLVGTHTFTR